MAIDQHVLWTFFASLLGFVLLYTLRRRNCSNANKKELMNKSYPEECAKQSFSDGESRPLEGSGTDVIIVGAGVAGAALAHTLGMVTVFSLKNKELLKFENSRLCIGIKIAKLVDLLKFRYYETIELWIVYM